MDRRRWNVRDLERHTRAARDLLGTLLQEDRQGRSVLALLFARAQLSTDPLFLDPDSTRPDGFPSSSLSAAPALSHPAAQPALRTSPEDALRRKREHGYALDSSAETAVMGPSHTEDALGGRLGDTCPVCEGTGDVQRENGVAACRECSGSGRRYYDPVGEAVDDLARRLVQCFAALRLVDKRRGELLSTANAADVKTAPRVCEGCHRPLKATDPIRRGLCGTCEAAYRRWRAENRTDDEPADRLRFCLQREKSPGHHAAVCELCTELARRPTDAWRDERRLA